MSIGSSGGESHAKLIVLVCEDTEHKWEPLVLQPFPSGPDLRDYVVAMLAEIKSSINWSSVQLAEPEGKLKLTLH